MNSVPVRGRTGRHSLPTGIDGALWKQRSEVGEFDFRGKALTIEVDSSSGVLFPGDCGLSLLEALQSAPELSAANRTVLDIGCGSGLYTLAMLAEGARKVTALDVNPAALRFTKLNARRNGLPLELLACAASDITCYSAAQPFDLVVTNPPHLPSDEAYADENGMNQALIGCADGRFVYDLVIDRAAELVAPDGLLLMAYSSLTNVPQTTARVAAFGFGSRELALIGTDIPLRAYANHAHVILDRLAHLREQGRAEFADRRFFVYAMAYRRAWSEGRR